MGSLLTNKDHFQALVVPDGRYVAWDAQTTASPDGGRAAIDTSSGLHVEPVDLGTGAPSQGVTLTCTRSGLPAPTDGNLAASYVAEHVTDGITYGLDECYHLTGVSSALDTFSYGSVSMAVTSKERLVGASTRAGTDRVYFFSQQNDATTTTVHAGIASLQLRSSEGHPAVFAYGDGLARVLYADIDTTSDKAIRIGVSTLDGSDVERDGVDVLGDGLKRVSSGSTSIGSINSITRMAAAARGDEVLLVMAVDYHSASTHRTNARSTLRQYASTDGGLSFRFIGEMADDAATDIAAAPVVLATDSGFEVYYAGWTGTLSYVYRRAIGSAYAPLSSSVQTSTTVLSAASVTSGVMTLTYRPAAWIDHRGVRFVINEEGNIVRSEDGGLTWDDQGNWAEQNGLDHIQPWSAVYHRAQAVIAVDRASAGVSTDTTISLLSLGGWSNYTWGPDVDGARDWERPQWEVVYVPAGGVQRLTDVTVTATSVSQTLTRSVNRLTSSASFGNARIKTTLGTISSARGAAFEGSGSTSADATALGLANLEYPVTWDLDIVDGIETRYGLRVTHQDGELKLHERTGASTFSLKATVSISDARADVRILIENGKGRAYYRTQSSSSTKATSALRGWTAFTSGITLTNAHDASAPATSTANVYTRMDDGDIADLHWFGVRGDGLVDYNLTPMISASGYTPRGAEFAYRPLFVRPDVVIKAVGGAARGTDTHTIAAVYDYGVDKALTTDPRAGFREASGATGSLQLAYQIDGAGGNDTALPGEALAVALVGANFAKYTVQVYSGGAWLQVAAVDARVDVAWLSDGRTVRPDPANNSSGPLVREGEFNGSLFVEDTTGSAAGVRINNSLTGNWTEDNFAPQLQCDDAPTTASGTNGAIIPRTSAALFRVGSSGIQGVRIVVAADERSHAGGQLEVGRIVLGRILPHGTSYSWGRVVTMEPGASVTELRDRSSRRVVDAEPRRVVDIAWADGLMTRGASTDDDDPDFYGLFGATMAQAGANMTAWEVYGLLQSLNGSQPVVYVPRVERQTGSGPVVLGRRDELVYGRLEGEARWEVVLGEEGISEVVRGLGFTIREVV